MLGGPSKTVDPSELSSAFPWSRACSQARLMERPTRESPPAAEQTELPSGFSNRKT